MNNKALVLNHLKEHGSITPLEAANEYGIMRLGARVWDLRDEGWPIKTTLETGINRFGIPVRYARYSMEVKEHGNQQMPGVPTGRIEAGPVEV